MYSINVLECLIFPSTVTASLLCVTCDRRVTKVFIIQYILERSHIVLILNPIITCVLLTEYSCGEQSSWDAYCRIPISFGPYTVYVPFNYNACLGDGLAVIGIA